MFGVLASSAGCSASNKGHSSSNNANSHQHQRTNVEPNHNKNVQEKERETFLTDELFNIISNKRNAELVQKQHKHDHAKRTYSHPHLFQCHKKKRGSHDGGKCDDGEQKRRASGMNGFVLASLTCIGSDPFTCQKNSDDEETRLSEQEEFENR